VKVWVQPGMEKAVQRELLDLDQFMTADVTAGEQDLICLVEASSYEDLLQTVMKMLRSVKGVTRTVTNLILEVDSA
jgi:nitrate reductase NapAB chaperone NapD